MARVRCPGCGSDRTHRERNNPNKRPKAHPEVNAVFRACRCDDCGQPFATVEVVATGVVAEYLERLVGGWSM